MAMQYLKQYTSILYVMQQKFCEQSPYFYSAPDAACSCNPIGQCNEIQHRFSRTSKNVVPQSREEGSFLSPIQDVCSIAAMRECMQVAIVLLLVAIGHGSLVPTLGQKHLSFATSSSSEIARRTSFSALLGCATLATAMPYSASRQPSHTIRLSRMAYWGVALASAHPVWSTGNVTQACKHSLICKHHATSPRLPSGEQMTSQLSVVSGRVQAPACTTFRSTFPPTSLIWNCSCPCFPKIRRYERNSPQPNYSFYAFRECGSTMYLTFRTGNACSPLSLTMRSSYLR